MNVLVTRKPDFLAETETEHNASHLWGFPSNKDNLPSGT